MLTYKQLFALLILQHRLQRLLNVVARVQFLYILLEICGIMVYALKGQIEPGNQLQMIRLCFQIQITQFL